MVSFRTMSSTIVPRDEVVQTWTELQEKIYAPPHASHLLATDVVGRLFCHLSCTASRSSPRRPAGLSTRHSETHASPLGTLASSSTGHMQPNYDRPSPHSPAADMHHTFNHAPSMAAHHMQYTNHPAPLYTSTPSANGTHPPPGYTPDHTALSAPQSGGSPYMFPYRPAESPALHIQPSPPAPTEGQLIDTDDDVGPRLAKAKEELMGVCGRGGAGGGSLGHTVKFSCYSGWAIYTSTDEVFFSLPNTCYPPVDSCHIFGSNYLPQTSYSYGNGMLQKIAMHIWEQQRQGAHQTDALQQERDALHTAGSDMDSMLLRMCEDDVCWIYSLLWGLQN